MTNAICVDSHTALSDAKITSSMICATNKDMGMCNHDSGGPLATLDPIKNFWTLIGVASWTGIDRKTMDCYNPKAPAVFARVTAQLKWINDNLTGEKCQTPSS